MYVYTYLYLFTLYNIYIYIHLYIRYIKIYIISVALYIFIYKIEIHSYIWILFVYGNTYIFHIFRHTHEHIITKDAFSTSSIKASLMNVHFRRNAAFDIQLGLWPPLGAWVVELSDRFHKYSLRRIIEKATCIINLPRQKYIYL